MGEENPALGQQRVANDLRKEGLVISPAGGVRCVWMRHQLQIFSLPLKALEKKVAEEGLVLTERQLHGQIETAHPGYLSTQDTFYVGTLKGVGRIYQQTFLDTYAKGGIC